ncbi:hypothetical protein B046DRAFT_04790 [Streptomyces sp. LamerLS-316]|uniref:hypothetical protein n=1 Tax=unclassified Streptomyces TaxID=2593676 RepID=UPI0008238B64|nr:hypothetical protein B046DRAFT_04790 [Streptomyces sp. LamerLS-316]
MGQPLDGFGLAGDASFLDLLPGRAEIEQARSGWMTSARFGDVHGYDGGRLSAPALPPVALKPRGRVC